VKLPRSVETTDRGAWQGAGPPSGAQVSAGGRERTLLERTLREVGLTGAAGTAAEATAREVVGEAV